MSSTGPWPPEMRSDSASSTLETTNVMWMMTIHISVRSASGVTVVMAISWVPIRLFCSALKPRINGMVWMWMLNGKYGLINRALAGLGMDRTRLKVVADPALRLNTHTIRVSGACGRMTVVLENVPAPQNPKTSWLACYSALAALKSLTAKVRYGT